MQGVVATGANVSQWTNQASTISMTAQATMAVVSSSVSISTNDFNYNPSITFNGASNQKLAGTFATPTVNPALMFAVVKKTNLPNTVYANPYSLGSSGASGIAYNNFSRNFGIDYSTGPCGLTANINGIPGIVRADYASTTSTTGANTAYNGLLSTSGTCSAGVITPTDGTFEIGGRTFGGQPSRIFSGQIAEVIHFDMDALSGGAADINKIESYLALKYGLTLSNSGGGTNGNYTSSAGTTIWDANTISGYQTHVIGIGRDDASALLQKQSHQTDDGAQIYIGAAVATSNLSNTGSFSADLQFVMMGNNNATATLNAANTEFPTTLGLTSRFDREWKITNTGFTGTFSLSILPSSGSFVASKMRVLIDDDGDFSNATVIYPTVIISSGRIVLTGISNAMIASGATKFITIAVAPSPGGLADNIQLWTKANTGVVVSGTNVSQWNNLANTSMTTQASIAASTDIVYGNNDFNYNPSLTFTGTSAKRLSGVFATPSANPALMFAVVKKTVSPNNTNGNPYSLGADGAPGIGYVASGATGTFGIDYSGNTCAATANVMSIPGIVRADYNSTINTTGAATSFNGLLSTPACGVNVLAAADGNFEIGGRTFGGNSANIFSGQIAEIIHYDADALTGGAADINKIESYLAVKYGLTLSNSGGGTNGNYTSGAGTTIWDASIGSGYHNNVIGIGRDDNSSLLQKQSQQADLATRIYIGSAIAGSNFSNTGSFSTDAQFVMIGNDNATAALNVANTELPSLGLVSRFDREWKITNTGFTGTFSLSILPSSGSFTASKIRVLIDDDGDFSNATIIGPIVTVASGRIVLSGISTAMIASGATKYITLALAVSPGGLTDNIQLWTKADAGVTATGSNVSQWTNLASANTTVQASIAASADITWNPNSFNYNPTLTFSGASGKVLSGTFSATAVMLH
jgi:energy-converting hydrogenase Eha subunit F